MGRRGRGHRRARPASRSRSRPPATCTTWPAAAFAEAYGNDAVESGIGGSIPFIAEFARAYPGATVLVTGVGDPASRWHGIDESLHLGMWERACLAEVLLLDRLAG